MIIHVDFSSTDTGKRLRKMVISMNKKVWFISGGLVAAIGLSFVFLFQPANSKKAPDYAYSGIVEQEEYNLSFKIGGRIASMNVEEGQFIQKGTVIGTLEKGEWQAKVDDAKAAVALAMANVNKATVSVGVLNQTTQAKVAQAKASLQQAKDKFAMLSNGPRKEEIAQLEAKLEAAQAAYNHALDVKRKMDRLFASGAISQEQKNEADVAFENAKANLTAAQKSLDMAKQGARQEELAAARDQVELVQGTLQEALSGRGQVQITANDVKAAQGQLERAKASLEEAKIYLSYTELRSPISGVVIHKNVKVGEMVSQGFTAVTVADPSDKWVKFYVPETSITSLKLNQTVHLEVPSLHAKVTGMIESINPAPQFAAQKATNYLQDRDIRSFEVRVKITEGADQVYAGMTANWNGR
jgi:HlyD family secretion protein